MTADSVEKITPKNIAIIMDGNNRWAKQRKLPKLAGHKAGLDAVRNVVETCLSQKVESLTLFAFSSENWNRPEDEVKGLMSLFLLALKNEVRKLHKNNIRLRIMGDKSRFSDTLQAHIHEAEQKTKDNDAMTLVIAANYGGEWDIVNAAQQCATDVALGKIKPEDISRDYFESHIGLSGVSAPDLYIRTGGETRISNFMLWQAAYAELYFSDLYWPDFKEEALLAAIADFGRRQRRFGMTCEQVESNSGL
ncbi:polyprenyl diphosphate synthase [Litoribacillus peritrichatus]|uniref:Ditrans,polycis-undecaprenyl-diphosphate synthase ((2E,6E)-farnesyl-diphosphate specific) n=1 Tax=Litoribacillus peritrichatus TaxID=718191 RepID=A0ABP7N940_9GAMM